MQTPQKILILGATSAMAHHCARIWAAENKASFILVGRDADKLARISQDIAARSADTQVSTVIADLLDPAAVQKLVDEVYEGGAVDTALIAHGSLPEQADCSKDLAVCDEALKINGLSPVYCMEALANKMLGANKGQIIVIGSVAGDRGRKSNYTYGAAKGLVARYAQGLQHRFAGSNVKLTLVKPGPTATPMTASLAAKGMKMAKVEDVARAIVNGAAKGKFEVYAPAKWALIMLIIIHLPRFVFHKLNI
jgi:short-subunit dehydrogenase